MKIEIDAAVVEFLQQIHAGASEDVALQPLVDAGLSVDDGPIMQVLVSLAGMFFLGFDTAQYGAPLGRFLREAHARAAR